MASALQCALQLAEEWSIPVFPCSASKAPLTEHGFKDASCSIEQITTWWERWPDALVGVPTGSASKLLVIDVDPDGLNWYRAHHLKLAAGRIHQTPRGRHLLYRYPEGDPIGNSAGRLAVGVDVRAEGGYIIWWPAHGHRIVGDDAADAPPELLERLRKRTQAIAGESRANGGEAVYREGQRHAAILQIAASLRRKGLQGRVLEAALIAWNADHCDPPQELADVERIARDYSGKEGAPHIGIVRAECSTWLADVGVHEDAVYLVSKLWPEQALAVIFGAPGCGKSTLALDIAFAIAHGAPWRKFPTRRGLVAYSAGEGRIGVERRLVALKREHTDLAGGALWLDWSVPNLRESAAVEALIGRVREAERQCGLACTLMMIDTLARHLYGSDSDPEHMGELLASVELIRRELKCSVGLIHHSGKDASRGARGHSSLLAAADTEIEITAPGPNWCTVTKQRDGERLPPLAFELLPVMIGRDATDEPIQAVTVVHRDLAPPRREPKGDQQAKVLMELERRSQAGEPAWTGADIAKVARELGVPRPTAYAMAQRLTAGGFLRRSVGGYALVSVS
jgi:hypothetical protein